MKRIKKAILSVAFCVLLCGATVVAGTSAERHVHAYSENKVVYNSYVVKHQYLVAVHVDSSGRVTNEYGECDIAVYKYKKYNKCGCGEQQFIGYGEYSVHHQCGQ